MPPSQVVSKTRTFCHGVVTTTSCVYSSWTITSATITSPQRTTSSRDAIRRARARSWSGVTSDKVDA